MGRFLVVIRMNLMHVAVRLMFVGDGHGVS
jgi:hypothetical protein